MKSELRRALIVVAALGVSPGAAPLAAAQQTKVLPRPPGAQVTTLPRKMHDKPQEAALVVNPRNPNQLVVSYHQAIDEGSDHHPDVRVQLLLASSADGGKSWAITDTTHRDYTRSLDATLAYDLHGHAFLVHMGLDDMSPMTRAGEFVRRSLDGGRTWQPHITLAEQPGNQKPLLNHMPNLVADNDPRSPHAGNVYAVWDRQTFSADKATIALLKSEVVLARTTDEGKTWSSPRAVLEFPGGFAHTTAVSDGGTVYIMISRSKGAYNELLISASRDGGMTFGEPLPVVKTHPAAGPRAGAVADFPRAGGWPVMAMDPRGTGRLFVVWGDHRFGDRDIFAVSSADGGQTWSTPVRVNDDAKSNGRDQVMNWLAVDPVDGSAYVVFYDRRGDANNKRATVTLARSSDGGRTFVNYDWSGASVDPTTTCLGDYLGIGAHGGRVYGAWIENAEDPPRTNVKPPRQGRPGEMVLKDADWPWDPALLKVGAADFRSGRDASKR